MAIPTAIQDDTSIVTGTDAGTTTNVGHHAAHHVAMARALNTYFFVDAPTGVAATDTAAIQAGCAEAFAAGGGRVILKSGIYVVNATIALKSKVWLEGQGQRATTIFAANGLNDNIVENFVSPDGIVGNGQLTAVRHLCIDGNRANQTTGSGIKWEVFPAWTMATNDIVNQYDAHQRCEHVWIRDVKRDAIEGIDSRAGNMISHLNIEKTGRYGIKPTSDWWIDSVNIGEAGECGVFTENSNLFLSNIACFYSGQAVGANGHGFAFQTPAGEAGSITLVNCHAQDNWGSGYQFNTVQNVMASACSADSNSRNSSGALPAIDFWETRGCQLQIACFERSYDGSSGYQKNALRMRSNSTGNKIFITHKATRSPATVGAAIMSGSTTHGENELKINGQGGSITAAYASSYTPDPYVATTHIMTLTGNLSLAVPANAHTGAKLELILIQDATGGRVTTFNAAYNAQVAPSLAPGVPTRLEFTYSGSAWFQSFPSPDAPQVKRTVADVTNSTTTAATLTDLDFPLLASTDYTFQYLLSFTTAATSTGLAVQVTLGAPRRRSPTWPRSPVWPRTARAPPMWGRVPLPRT